MACAINQIRTVNIIFLANVASNNILSALVIARHNLRKYTQYMKGVTSTVSVASSTATIPSKGGALPQITTSFNEQPSAQPKDVIDTDIRTNTFSFECSSPAGYGPDVDESTSSSSSQLFMSRENGSLFIEPPLNTLLGEQLRSKTFGGRLKSTILCDRSICRKPGNRSKSRVVRRFQVSYVDLWY
jgi:hypothetical protein